MTVAGVCEGDSVKCQDSAYCVGVTEGLKLGGKQRGEVERDKEKREQDSKEDSGENEKEESPDDDSEVTKEDESDETTAASTTAILEAAENKQDLEEEVHKLEENKKEERNETIKLEEKNKGEEKEDEKKEAVKVVKKEDSFMEKLFGK